MVWGGLTTRPPPGCFPWEAIWTDPSGWRWRLQGRPKTHWGDYISQLVLKQLRILPEELVEVARERRVWASLLKMSRDETELSYWYTPYTLYYLKSWTNSMWILYWSLMHKACPGARLCDSAGKTSEWGSTSFHIKYWQQQGGKKAERGEKIRGK